MAMKAKLSKHNKITLLLITNALILSIQKMALAVDTINATQTLTDGDILVSSDGNFALGFFNPEGNSNNRYVGIWYNKVKEKTIVWVANRGAPLTNTSGSLKVIKPGILVLVNETNDTIWSTNTSSTIHTPVAQLLDSGNLVVRDAEDRNSNNFLWQSFDYPTDTMLPGMKLGWNFTAHLEVYLSSWRTDHDPAPGEFTMHCDPSGYPQANLKKSGVEYYRTGPWNGLSFSRTPNFQKNAIFSSTLVLNKNAVYYYFELLNNSVFARFTLSPTGVAQRWTWFNDTQGWVLFLSAPSDDCDSYGLCGAYSMCNFQNSPLCGCLDEFVPKDPEGWGREDWSKGCVRKEPLDCKNDGFIKYSVVKLPDTKRSWYNESMNLEECKVLCLQNCSCMGYSNLDIRGNGSGCLLWFDGLIDIKKLLVGQDIYVRMASSEFGRDALGNASKGGKKPILLGILLLVLGIMLIGLSVLLYSQKRKILGRLRKRGNLSCDHVQMMPCFLFALEQWSICFETAHFADGLRLLFVNNSDDESHGQTLELPIFDLRTLSKATDNFSNNNKLGEGGFGPVYKGLLDGQEIAVKRLSTTSHQGVDEFKNEVICIAKLQHRNLVKLLGCCIEGEEKVLVYEYMTNKSLDSILFDQSGSNLLDWPMRFHIINGIARGLLYLHQDSRLRVIHRDLKASNILLDSDMNPKISDFGLARSFGGNETGANTNRVMGTYGYMSPEYAVDGLFSVKSDVFSFGVLLLEIISGKKNRGFSHRDHSLNLLGHAWMLHREGRSLELADSYLGDSGYISEVLRSIHVGLLCVQQAPEDRPNMSTVVLMLGNDGVLPQPKQPGFFTGRNVSPYTETSDSSNAATSTNEITITNLYPR